MRSQQSGERPSRSRGSAQARRISSSCLALLAMGMLPAVGCRGRNLIGSRDGDGGPPDMRATDDVAHLDGTHPVDVGNPDVIAPGDGGALADAPVGDAPVVDAAT